MKAIRDKLIPSAWRVNLLCRRLFGLHLPDPDPMNYQVTFWLIILSVGLGVTLLASNLAAVKVWNLCGIPVDGGIWLFPATYIMGDLLVEVYGEKIANVVALYCAGLSTVVILIFCAISFLPDFPGINNDAFVVLRNAFGRVSLASVAGFLCSQIVNNRIFVRVRVADLIRYRSQDDRKQFYHRAFISSAIAHMLDSLLFETLAFFGRVSFSDFLLQAAFAYVVGFVLEVPLSLLTLYLLKHKLYRLHYSDGRIQHNY